MSQNEKGRYTTSHPDIARQACSMFNCIDPEIARLFGIDRRTITRWKVKYPEFAQALQIGRNDFILRTPPRTARQILNEQRSRKALSLKNRTLKRKLKNAQKTQTA